jgi:CHRD domain
MHNQLRTAGLATIAFTTLAFWTIPAFAEATKFKANLAASSEVPANDSKGTGVANVSYDAASKTMTWSVTFSALTGSATAAHFHGPADVGANAGVAVPIPGSASPMAGEATLTDEQAADLVAEKWYVNVHTDAHKDGEIRGQMLKAQ